MFKKLLPFLSMLIVLGFVSACSGTRDIPSAYYLVDPRFGDLYERLDGTDVLGPPISNKKYVAGTNQEKQYFEGAVLVYDPDNSPRYFLESVGIDAGFSDLPNTDPENSAVKYLNGFIIPLEFSQFYEKMGGERWVGFPLTRARLNPDKNTIEQYYENMGFFRFEDDPPGNVYLMPYGLWKCAGECSKYPGLDNAGISGSVTENVQPAFGEAISRLGTRFTGDAISSPYRAEDGKVEQIFQNVIMFENANSPLGVSLRSVSSLIEFNNNFQNQQENAGDYFRAVEGNTGFYIPSYFMEFIDRYFGFEFSGEPISSLEEIRDGVSQQCFENYCLLYDALADPGNQVRVFPLGQKYKESHQKQANSPPSQPEVKTQRVIQLDIWEQMPQIASYEKQQIGACIHDSGTPLANVIAEVTVNPTSQGSKTYAFSPTDSGGCSFLELDPIQGDNGTTVDYQVCFNGIGNQNYCKKDSYLIWGNTDSTLTEIPEVVEPTVQPEQAEFTLDTWELYPQISSAEKQEVGACVHLNNQPEVNLDAQLILETPNSGLITYQSSPTDEGGCSFFELKPINANNGETIPYQVCFINKYGENLCKRDSFLIWGNP